MLNNEFNKVNISSKKISQVDSIAKKKVDAEFMVYQKCKDELEKNMSNIINIIQNYNAETYLNVVKMYLAIAYFEMFLKSKLPIQRFKKIYGNHNITALISELTYDKQFIDDKTKKIIEGNVFRIEQYFKHSIVEPRIRRYTSIRYNFHQVKNEDFESMHFFFEDRDNQEALRLYKNTVKNIMEELRV